MKSFIRRAAITSAVLREDAMVSPSRLLGRKRFYKYMKYDAAKKVLQNTSLQWSSPALLNDPFDLQFDLHMEYDRNQVANCLVQRFVDVYMGRSHPVAGSALDDNARLLRALMPHLKEADVKNEHRVAIVETLTATEQALPKLHDELRAMLAARKILCFSEVPNNVLMWAHYAENHSGAVLEFSYIEKYDSAWGAARPVRYLENMPRLADEKAMIRVLTGRGKLATPEHFQDSIYVKAADWAYEKEWRILGGWENDKPTELIGFKSEELTAVYLGCQMSGTNQDEIKKLVAKKYSHAGVQVGRKSARRFALEFGKID
jgi:hypothetical protein